MQISFTAGTEANPGNFNIKACTASNCSTGCVGATTTAASPGTIAAASLVDGTSYYGCVQSVDQVNHVSAWVNSNSNGTATNGPYKLIFVASPSDIRANATMSAVQVAVADNSNNIVLKQALLERLFCGIFLFEFREKNYYRSAGLRRI
jgi:hypothetical protein